jgi:hypothetical protein
MNIERSYGADAYPTPPKRCLRIYAFDPQASVELATAVINDAVVELPWEARWETPLAPGPVNDYLEVVDFDPAAGLFYAPVDLDHPMLLAQNGLPPSEGRPQFHQQMVFAVAMRTIRAFERALGRTVLWAADPEGRTSRDPVERQFTRRLRIYPHALREANAYYSPQKRALLFGYFRPGGSARRPVDAHWVFTCLSQDIVAHETTHAILHGMQRRSIEPSTSDSLAFHEAFADIVALFQHFGMTEVVRHQLAVSRGSLRTPGLLTGLAEQFGRAKGGMGALRYALGLLGDDARAKSDKAGVAPGTTPPSPGQAADPAATTHGGTAEPKTLANTREAHARGGFLVAAVFDAFVTIYERRTADLMRLGRAGRDAGGDSDLPHELVGRLATEAAKAAEQALRMCVRALDYLPPTGLRFGEYLRAIVTADNDLVPNDPLRYRVAFVEAFRKRGISVPGCISMAPDSLLWAPPDRDDCADLAALAQTSEDPSIAMFADLLGQLQLGVSFESGGGAGSVSYSRIETRGPDGPGRPERRNLRELAMHVVLHNQRRIHAWFDANTPGDVIWERLLGMRLLPQDDPLRKGHTLPPIGSITCKDDGTPKFEVHSARIARRAGPGGEEMHQLVVQLTQRRRAYFDPKEQAAADAGDMAMIGKARWDYPDFWFRGGATLHVDLRDGRLIRIIRKRIDDAQRLDAERAFHSGDDGGGSGVEHVAEPFAFAHRSDL